MSKENNIGSGLAWSFAERITAQIVTTLVGIVLARLLDPAHYGLISIVNVLITICNVFVSSGMGSAIVQKKEISDTDYNTAFFISLGISACAYLFLFLAAPLVARFYKAAVLTAVIRVMGLRLPLAAINNIQQAHVQREMTFKRFFIATLFGTVLSGFVGVWLAWRGAGVWALVAQYLTNTTVDTIVLFFVEKWFPRPAFSRKSAGEMFSFGWKVLATELVYTSVNSIRSLVVGKACGSADLAYYDQGQKYPALLVNNLNTAINKVMLPAFSRNQEDLSHLKSMLRRSISVGIFLLCPLLIGFCAVAKNFVIVILTDKWLQCVPLLQIFCIVYLTRPLESACHQALLSIGRSDTVLRIMVFINASSLIFSTTAAICFHSVFIVASASLLTSIISLTSFMVCAGRLLGYGIREQLTDLCPALFSGLIMLVCVRLVELLPISVFAILLIQIGVGAIVYLLCCKIIRLDAMNYVLSFLKSRHKK